MRAAIIYLTGEIIGKVSLFALFPLYGYYLSVADFGVVAILFPTIQTLQGALALGLPLGIMKYYYDLSDMRGEIYFNAFFVWLVVCSALGLIYLGIVSRSPLSEYSLSTYTLGDFSFYLLISLFGFALLTLAAQVYRAERRPLAFVGLNSGLRVLIFAGVALYLIFGMNPDALGVLRSIAWVTGSMFFIATVVLLYKGTLRINVPLCKELLFLGLPQVLSGLSGYVYIVGGRLFLNDGVSTEAVGVFGMVQGLVLGLSLLIAGFGKVYVPELFRRLSRGEFDQKFLDSTARLLLAALVCAAVAVQFTAPWLLQLIGKEEYLSGLELFPVLLMTVLFQGAYIVLVDILGYHKKTGFIALVHITISLLSLFLAWLLIPWFGTMGLAYAQVCAMLVQVVFVMVKATSLVEVRLPFKYWSLSWIGIALALQLMFRTQSNWVGGAILTVAAVYFSVMMLRHRYILHYFK